VPVLVLDGHDLAQDDSLPGLRFLAESLRELESEPSGKGARLLFRKGPSGEALAALARQTGRTRSTRTSTTSLTGRTSRARWSGCPCPLRRGARCPGGRRHVPSIAAPALRDGGHPPDAAGRKPIAVFVGELAWRKLYASNLATFGTIRAGR
jgi:hypothetical protein